jgi:membrane protein
VWSLLKETATSWVDHKDARLGAALAYYAIFSVGPLVLIAIAVAGLLFGQDAVRGEVSSQMQGLLGNSGAQAVQSMLRMQVARAKVFSPPSSVSALCCSLPSAWLFS